MSAVYWNHLSGVVDDNPLTLSDTTLNSTGLASMPAITAPDFMWLVLDPNGTAGAPEIVKVTAHTASATSCTIVRGQQTGTGGWGARQHLQNTVWANAQTVSDFDDLPFKKLTTTGDILYASAANTASRLGIGTAGQVLEVSGGVPAWGQVDTAGIADDAVTRAKLAADTLPSVGQVATNQATSSATYTDLATSGPAVTLTTGTLVRVTIAATSDVTGNVGLISVAVSGASAISAPPTELLTGNPLRGQVASDGPTTATGIVAVTAGTNTFTMKYAVSGGGSVSFANRFLLVERLN